MKSVQIRSFFWSTFPCIRTEHRKIRTRKVSVFGHFSRSVGDCILLTFKISRKEVAAFLHYTTPSVLILITTQIVVWFSHMNTHCVKSVQIRSFFWSVFSRIRTRKTPHLVTFHTVTFSLNSFKYQRHFGNLVNKYIIWQLFTLLQAMTPLKLYV